MPNYNTPPQTSISPEMTRIIIINAPPQYLLSESKTCIKYLSSESSLMATKVTFACSTTLPRIGFVVQKALILSWTFTLSLHFHFDYMINYILITWSWSSHHPPYFSLLFQLSTLSMPITFQPYLAIISDHLLYCPMPYHASTSHLMVMISYLFIIFVLLTSHLIVLHSAFFLLDILLHLLLGIILYLPPHWLDTFLLSFLQSSKYSLHSYWLIVQLSNLGCLQKYSHTPLYIYSLWIHQRTQFWAGLSYLPYNNLDT